jgi:hypothetical protein
LRSFYGGDHHGYVPSEEELQRQAGLMHLEGFTSVQIADHLGVPVTDVELWIAEKWATWREAMAAVQLAEELPGTHRLEDAVQLLAQERFITVEVSRDPDWPADGGDAIIGFADLASRGFSDLVDESVYWLLNRPEVRDATREDRESICVWGRLDLDRLNADLTAWWTDRLREIANTS